MQSALPKVLHKLASVPMIDWILGTVKDMKTEDCVMVISPQMNMLKEHIISRGDNIKFAVQENKLGTADATYNAWKRGEANGSGHYKNKRYFNSPSLLDALLWYLLLFSSFEQSLVPQDLPLHRSNLSF